MATPPREAFSLLKLLSSLAGAMASSRTRRMLALLRLANRKIILLQASHDMFLESFVEIREHLEQLSSNLSRTHIPMDHPAAYSDMHSLFSDIRLRREARRSGRILDYMEAKEFSLAEFDKTVFSYVQTEVGEKFRHFMRAYCMYFELDSIYQHELGRIVGQLAILINNLGEISKKPGKNSIKQTSAIMLRINNLNLNLAESILQSNERWTFVTMSYSQLRVKISELGLLEGPSPATQQELPTSN